MIILVGKSGSGKTRYFKKQHPDGVEKHAWSIEELVSYILAKDNPFFEEKAPLLINAWCDLDCEQLIPYAATDICIETHWFETEKGRKPIKKEKRYLGLKNLDKIRKHAKVIEFRSEKQDWEDTRLEYIKEYGTVFRYVESFLDD
jgi:hypothetical protein